MRTMLKSKIHRARVTGANLEYEGSIAIDSLLMEAADILPYEKVQVLNLNNGAPLETYAIEGPPASGTIHINGAAARLVCRGDLVIILSYSTVPDEGYVILVLLNVRGPVCGVIVNLPAPLSAYLPGVAAGGTDSRSLIVRSPTVEHSAARCLNILVYPVVHDFYPDHVTTNRIGQPLRPRNVFLVVGNCKLQVGDG